MPDTIRSAKRRKLSHDDEATGQEAEPTPLRRSSRRSNPSARAVQRDSDTTPTNPRHKSWQAEDSQESHWAPSSPSTPHVLSYTRSGRAGRSKAANGSLEEVTERHAEQARGQEKDALHTSGRKRGRPPRLSKDVDDTSATPSRRRNVTIGVKETSPEPALNSTPGNERTKKKDTSIVEDDTAIGVLGEDKPVPAMSTRVKHRGQRGRANGVSHEIEDETLDEQGDTLDPLQADSPDTVIVARRPKVTRANGDHMTEAAIETDTTPKIKVNSTQLDFLKQVVLGKLAGRRPMPLVGLDDEYAKVNQLVEQTVLAGESNSMLVIGARGTGKTTMVNKILREARKDHKEHFHVIYLNGFIHTDDKLAIRDIWRQLGKEMEVEGDDQTKHYGDALSKLLALLSHPSELSTSESGGTAKSVIFIIDEFDLFAAHPRQTLLYNLFDTAQSRKAPIAVLGLTTRVDIAEHLEKRVKSRFSHRYVHLTLSGNLVAFRQICKSALQISPEELNFDERARLAQATPDVNKAPSSDLLSAWNSSIENVFKMGAVSKNLARVFYSTKSVPDALNLFVIPVSLLDASRPLLTSAAFATECLLSEPDSKLQLLAALPLLALAMLIAAARLDIILDSDTCNFNMAYEEYCNLAAKARMASSGAAGGTGMGGKVWGRAVAKRAWEKLLELGLLMPVVGAALAGASDMVRCDVALEEIEGAVPDLERGLEKWCREI